MYQDSDQKQSFLEKVDIFGIGIARRFSHLPRHNTRFGGLITISILAIISSQIVHTLMSIITYSSPQVIQSDDYVFEPEPFQITPQTFNISMGLQDKYYNQFQDEKIYHVKTTQQTLKKVFNSTCNQYDSIWTYEPLNMSTCSQNNFQIQEIKSYFLGISFPVMYCFDVKQHRASIQGEFSANIYKAIEIQFIECVDKDYCASTEEKAKFLTNPTLGKFFFQQNCLDLKQGKSILGCWKKLSSFSIQKYIILNLMNLYINSDFSLFGTSKTTQRIVQVSSYQEQVVPRSDPVLFRLFFFSYQKNINPYFSSFALFRTKKTQIFDKSSKLNKKSSFLGQFNHKQILIFDYLVFLCQRQDLIHPRPRAHISYQSVDINSPVVCISVDSRTFIPFSLTLVIFCWVLVQ